MEEDIMNCNLYELIGANPSATTSEIKKAYRKKALSCHPDKNPDNPRAAELFHQLSKALEILTDASARVAYDKVLNARHQAKLRASALDSKRKKLKDDLEAREEAYKNSLQTNITCKTNEERLKAEIERLQKEGSKQVEEEIEFLRKKVKEQLSESSETNSDPKHNRIKIKWKCEKNDSENGGYNYDILHRFLSKYGDINILIISSNKKGRGMVEYKDSSSAKMAAEIEIGLAENPLILQGLWDTDKISEQKKNSFEANVHSTTNSLFQAYRTTNKISKNENSRTSFSSAPDIFHTQKTANDAEFESSVLSNLRRAEERKRLIEQMKTEEDS